MTLRCARDKLSRVFPSLPSYELAWHDFRVVPHLTPDEKASGPEKLRSYIKVLIDVGERDPIRIAKAALALTREYEQTLHSRARLMSGQ